MTPSFMQHLFLFLQSIVWVPGTALGDGDSALNAIEGPSGAYIVGVKTDNKIIKQDPAYVFKGLP